MFSTAERLEKFAKGALKKLEFATPAKAEIQMNQHAGCPSSRV
jgi:hypothetical protein